MVLELSNKTIDGLGRALEEDEKNDINGLCTGRNGNRIRSGRSSS